MALDDLVGAVSTASGTTDQDQAASPAVMEFRQLCAAVTDQVEAGTLGRTTTKEDVDQLTALPPQSQTSPPRTAHDRAAAALFLDLLGKDPAASRLRGFRPQEHSGTPPPGAVRATKGSYDAKGQQDIDRWPQWHLGTYVVVGHARPVPAGTAPKQAAAWGDKDDQIGSMPAFFAEHDDLTQEQQAAFDWTGLGLPAPTVSVWSGSKSAHRYWVLDVPCTDLWRWRFMTWRLIQVAGSDPSVENWSRVMRLPGCVAINRDGTPKARSVIDPTLSTGLPVTLAAFEHGLTVAEAKKGLDPLDAIPASRMTKSATRDELRQVLQAHYPHLLERFGNQSRVGASLGRTTQKFSPKAKANLEQINLKRMIAVFLDAVEAGQMGGIDDMRDALSHYPRRVEGEKGYREDRTVLWALTSAAAMAGLDSPVDVAIELMEEHSPSAECGWDISQVAQYNHSVKAATFWWKCLEYGWAPSCGWDTLLDQGAQKASDHLERMGSVDAHQRIEELLQAGASESEVQAFINTTDLPGYGLAKFAEQKRAELQRCDEAADAAVAIAQREALPDVVITDHLPPVLVDACRVLLDGVQAPPEAIVVTVLTAITSWLHPSVRVCSESLRESLVLWTLLVGPSGNAKTVVLKALIEDPCTDQVEPWLRTLNDTRMAEWQAACQKAEKGEGVPKRPRPMNALATDGSTPEGLQADMADWGGYMSILHAVDELDSWVTTMQRTDEAAGRIRGFWNKSYSQAFHCASLAEATKSRKITLGKISLIGGVQPGILRDAIESVGTSSGFWARPIMVNVPTMRRTLLPDRGEQRQLNTLLGQLYRDLLAGEHQYAGGCLRPRPSFVLTKPAQAVFRAYFDHCETMRLGARTEAQQALYAKAASTVLRMCPAQQIVVDHWDMEPGRRCYWEDDGKTTADRTEDELDEAVAAAAAAGGDGAVWITAATVRLCIRLVTLGKGLSLSTHQDVEDEGAAMASQFLRAAQKLLRKLSADDAGAGVSLRDVGKNGWNSRNRPATPELKALATTLHTQGLIGWDSHSKKVLWVKPGVVTA
jgi:hypothetical protein